MKAASEVGGSNALAVLNVMIPRSGHKKLLQDFPKRENSHHFSSIYIDQPIDRQLRLIAAAFPDRHSLGVLYAAPAPEEIGELKLKSAEYGFSLYADEINTNVSLFQEIQELLKHSDVFLSLPSPLFSTAQPCAIFGLHISSWHPHGWLLIQPWSRLAPCAAYSLHRHKSPIRPVRSY
jgi:hypothetical protein